MTQSTCSLNWGFFFCNYFEHRSLLINPWALIKKEKLSWPTWKMADASLYYCFRREERVILLTSVRSYPEVVQLIRSLPYMEGSLLTDTVLAPQKLVMAEFSFLNGRLFNITINNRNYVLRLIKTINKTCTILIKAILLLCVLSCGWRRLIKLLFFWQKRYMQGLKWIWWEFVKETLRKAVTHKANTLRNLTLAENTTFCSLFKTSAL